MRVWDAVSGLELRQCIGHQASVRSVAFSPDGHRLASGSDDGTIRLWEAALGKLLATFLQRPEGWVSFTPEGRYKLGGQIAGGFWYAIGLCRFEPGELDEFLPGLIHRVPDGERLIP